MAHALQKLSLGKVCALRLQRSRLEGLLILLLPAQLLLAVALVGLAAQQLQKEQDDHVSKGSHARIAHGRDIYLPLRAVNIDVKTASLPYDAVGVLPPGGAVHMDHTAIGAARL